MRWGRHHRRSGAALGHQWRTQWRTKDGQLAGKKEKCAIKRLSLCGKESSSAFLLSHSG
jgi:hypothetical protein